MGRPIFPHELTDPDFTWLISNFQENSPSFIMVESTTLPVVFIEGNEALRNILPKLPALPPTPTLTDGEPDSEHNDY